MDMQGIGAAIRRARKEKGLTQGQLAGMLGMSRATVSGIETGAIPEVGVRKLMALCGALGLALSVAPENPYPTYQELRAGLRRERDGKPA